MYVNDTLFGRLTGKLLLRMGFHSLQHKEYGISAVVCVMIHQRKRHTPAQEPIPGDSSLRIREQRDQPFSVL